MFKQKLLALHLYPMKFHALKMLYINSPVYIKVQQQNKISKFVKPSCRIFVLIISVSFFLYDWIIYRSLFGINMDGMETDSVVFNLVFMF